MRIIASAPGKAILMGEHAAVYGRPALVAAVDRRLVVEIVGVEGDGLRLELPEVQVSEIVSWGTIQDYAATARDLWAEYEKQPGPEAFRRLRGDDPAHLVKVAIGEALKLAGEQEPPGVELRLRSAIPIGAGFGSSAAAAVAIAVGCLRLFGVTPNRVELERLSLEIERRQHGTPSGIDTATVIRGGLVWAARDPAGHLKPTPVAIRSSELDKVRIFNTGTPLESTGEVVAAVRARRNADRAGFDRLLERMETATRLLRRRLESETEADLLGPIRDFEACLEEAGVVPPSLRDVIRWVEGRGGAAKISGAGALSGTGAGSLLIYHPEPGEVEGWDFLESFESLYVRMGAEGARLETVDSVKGAL